MKKKVLSMLITFAMLFSMLPATALAVEGEGTIINLSGGSCTIETAGEYAVSAYDGANTLTVKANATITLADVNITAAADTSAISIESGSVTLIVDKDSTLIGGDNGAGIYVAEDASVTIQSKNNAKLTAIGNAGEDDNSGAAGIGGTKDNGNSGAITIDGATVLAKGHGRHGAGIGSGNNGEVKGEIKIINSADVTAYGGYCNFEGEGPQKEGASTDDMWAKKDYEGGAAIGGGSGTGSTIANITITGSAVVAFGGPKSAGIGAGYWSNCANITITNSEIEAYGGSSSAGIGTSRVNKASDKVYGSGNEGTIVISGSTVEAVGGDFGAGIGTGYNADSCTENMVKISVKIESGEVNATGGMAAAGIGGGYKNGSAEVEITGGEVTAEAGAPLSEELIYPGQEEYTTWYDRTACAIGSGAHGDHGVNPFETERATVTVSSAAEVSVTAYEDGKLAIEGVANDTLEDAYTEIKAPRTGTITPAYTRNDGFWGEGTSNSTESFVVELYEDGTKIASATLGMEKGGALIDGDVYVTWSIPFDGEDSEYWDVEWAEGYPKYDMAPDTVKLIADGTQVATNNVQFNAPDNLNKIVAFAEGYTGGVVAYTDLQAAINDAEDGDTVALLCDIEFNEENAFVNGTWLDGIKYTGDQNFTIDLNGKTISCSEDINDYLLYFINNGEKANEITLKNGTINGGSYLWTVITVGAKSAEYPTTLNLGADLTVNGYGSGNDGEDAVVKSRYGSTVNVLSGAKVTSSDALYGIAAGASSDDNTAVVNIYEGATVTMNKDNGIAVTGTGVLNIYGGTINSDGWAVYTCTTGTPVFTISGGTITGTDGAVAAAAAYEQDPNAAPTVVITGGEINGKISEEEYGNGSAADLTVSGGTFSVNPADYLAEGYAPLYYEGTYSVIVAPQVEGDMVAQVNNGTKYMSLEAAFAAAKDGDEVKILKAGTYALSTSGKDITVTGAVDGVEFDNIGAKNMGGANVTFNNVTFDYYPNVNYTGLQHSGDLTYNDCTINGQVFLYGTSETFNNCTFNQNSADAYNVWTYGAKAVAFNQCTFNSVGKSVLVYNEGACATDLTVTDTEFNASAPVEGKAAIEIDTSLMPDGTDIEIDDKTIATGFGTGSVSGNSLWNDKKDQTDLTVTVGEEQVWPIAVAQIDDQKFYSLQDALTAAEAGDTVTIFAGEYTGDVSVNKAITVVGETDAEGNNLVTINGKLSVTGTGITVKNLNVNNSSERAVYVSGGDILIEGCNLSGVHGLRYCYANNGDVTLKDCVITGSTYGVHFDGGTGDGDVIIEGCTITGWTSFGSAIEEVTITDTTFADGNYNLLRFYQDATLTSVTIPSGNYDDYAGSGMRIDTGNSGAGMEGITVTATGCKTADGSDFTGAFPAGVIVATDVTVDGELLGAVAKIGETSYKTLAGAVAAAQTGDTITLLTDTSEAERISIGSEKEITIVGQENGEGEDPAFTGWFKVTGKLTLKDVTLVAPSIAVPGETTSQYTKTVIGLMNTGDVVCENVTFDMSNAVADSTAITAWWSTGDGANITVTDCTFDCAGQRPIRSDACVTVEGCTFNDPYRYAVQMTSKSSTMAEDAEAYVVFNNNTIVDGENGKEYVYGVQLEGGYGCSDLTITGTGNTITADANDVSTLYFVENTDKMGFETIQWKTESAPVLEESTFAAKIAGTDGDIYLPTLAEAIELVAADGTVTLVANSTEEIEVSKALTIELNGFTAEKVAPADGYAVVKYETKWVFGTAGFVVPATGVTLSGTTSVKVGNTTTLTATVAPDNATNKNVTWTSSDTSVATVADGVVTGVAAGTATITVTTEDGGFTADCTVTVSRASSGGGGGGGGGSTSYTIAVEDTKNGDITVSPTRASSGSTVTITVDPDKGYVLETLTVLDKNGKEVDLTKKADNKYTFKMPSGKVTVEATFMEDNTMLNYFVDVFANDYYYDAVLWAVENGITNGTSATTFSPTDPCTRAQMATFLWRAAGSPEPAGSTNPFVDVPTDAYYAKAVQWAYEQGITGGTSATTFSPDETCTRGQMATFLWRDAGSSAVSGEGAPFVDVPADGYYATAVDWAYEEGITGGTSATTYSPNDPCTRGQMVTFLYRYLAE